MNEEQVKSLRKENELLREALTKLVVGRQDEVLSPRREPPRRAP